MLGGRIVGLDGDLDGVAARRTVDLDGAPALPGFHDAHHHLSLVGARLAAVDLRGVTDLGRLRIALRRHASTLPPGAWVHGWGYDQNVLGGRHPTAEDLDAVGGGRPVLIEHVSCHMVTADTRAFALAGHPGRDGVPDVPGGVVHRDASGRATGLLQERAMGLLTDLLRSDVDVPRNLGLAATAAVRHGLTSITEPGIGDADMIGSSPVDLHAYQAAADAGVLLVRATVMPYCTMLHGIAGPTDRRWFGLDLGLRTGLGDDRLRIGPVKIVADGSFIGRSAAMHRCYHGETGNHGVLQFEPDDLRRMIVGAHEAGWTVATHAIGDAAIDHTLDALEEATRRSPRPDVRHRIEHFALASDAQIARAAALGLVAVPQGRFISDFGDAMAAAVDPDLAPRIYRMKSLLRAGMVLPGSSDAPVSDAAPLIGIRDMVLRRTASGRILGPGERLTVDEAVRAYTIGSAYAAGRERDTGMLRPGMLADFVVLSDDPYTVDPDDLARITVGATVVGGEVVYDDGAVPS